MRASWRTASVAITVVAVVALVVAGLFVLRPQDEEATSRSVDEKLAAQIRSTGVTPYLVALDDAEMTSVKVESGLVLVDYDRGDLRAYTLVLEQAPSGDLCGEEGSGEREDGGSCTSDGDRMSTEFEEMGSFSMRKGDTLVTIGSLVIESDPDIDDRTFDALEKADAVCVDALAATR